MLKVKVHWCCVMFYYSEINRPAQKTRMASAGDGAPPPRGHVHRFTIPLAGVRPGQQITVRFMPPQVRKVHEEECRVCMWDNGHSVSTVKLVA